MTHSPADAHTATALAVPDMPRTPLAETCSVGKAASYVEVSPAAAYKLRNHADARAFREAWDGAMAPRFGGP